MFWEGGGAQARGIWANIEGGGIEGVFREEDEIGDDDSSLMGTS